MLHLRLLSLQGLNCRLMFIQLLIYISGEVETGHGSTGYKPFMEKLKLPTFSGKVKEWPEFRAVWKELFAGYPDSIQLQHLKSHIPAADARRITGIKNMEATWTRLGKIYGDTDLNIITV